MGQFTYKTIEKENEFVYRDKGSKFIAKIIPVLSENEIKLALTIIKKTYHDANHHCYAYRLGDSGENNKSSDDQEPSGTAGKPILNQLLSANITNVLLVVIRYFGGTKLGVSGLISAYKSSAKSVIESSILVDKKSMEKFRINFNYTEMNTVMRVLKQLEAEIIRQESDELCILEFSIWKRNEAAAVDQFNRFEKLTLSKI